MLISFYASTAFQKFRGAETFTERAMPRDDKKAGWHAMTLVGYDERRQAFRLINSWSSALGRSRLRLDQLRSPADPRQRRLYPRHWPGHAAAISAAAISAATISAAAVSAATISAANPGAAKANPGTV